MFSLRGRRPTDTTTMSTSSRSSPFLPSNATAVPSKPRTCTPVCTFIPRLVNARATVCATCWSTPVRICGQHLEQRHLGAHVDEERCELAADRAAADHRDARRHLVDLEHIIGREDAVAVEREPVDRQRPRRRTGRDRSRCDRGPRCRRRPRSSARRAASVPVPGTTVTLRSLEQRFEPGREPVDDAVLAGLRRRELERRGRDLDAELGRATHGAQHLGRLQQLLGGDAAPVQARAADALSLRPSRCSCRPTRRRAPPRSRPGPPPRTTRSKSSGTFRHLSRGFSERP